MSTSKENYDHLVYLDGNYGIDIANGIWPGSGQTPGIKGNKGQPGVSEKGQKGQKGAPGVNGSNGSQGPQGGKGGTGVEGPKGLKGSEGPVGPDGAKGDKGEKGIGDKGEKGQAAESPIFTFKGQVPTFADLPPTGNTVGDVWQTLDNDFLYSWDGTGWVTIADAIGVVKGQTGEKGQKGVTPLPGAKGQKGVEGAKGDGGGTGPKGQKGVEAAKGQKGLKGNKGLPGEAGTDGTDGNAGQKGQKGQGIDADDYYTKTETDFLIEDFKAPQYAFDVAAYPAASGNIITTGTVDFNSVDQNDAVYNSGIVTIGAGVTVANSPIASSELLVVNYVAVNAGDLRGTDYAMLQYAFNGGNTDIDASGYWRFCRPGQGEFGQWALSQFPASNYYTKSEVDALTKTYTVSSGDQGGNNTEVILTDDTGATSKVNIVTTGGLTSVASANTITIDASAISGNVTFLGPITASNPPTVAQDPATLETNPSGGDYFIFINGGTAWNGDTVTEGDWAIYRSAAPAGWVTLDYATITPGVASVDVAGGILTLTGTANDPVINLTTTDLEEAILKDYVTIENLGESLNNLATTDLSDVSLLGGASFNPSSGAFATYSTQLADNTSPVGTGQYSIIPELNTIWFNQSSDNSSGSFLINFMIQQSSLGDQWIIKANNGDWQHVVTYAGFTQVGGTRKIQFVEPTAAAAVDGYALGWSVRGKVTSLGIGNGTVLRYNTTSEKFEASTSYTKAESGAAFVAKSGSTMTGLLTIDRNAQAAASNSFVLRGRIESNGSIAANLLKTFISPVAITNAIDYVAYYGATDTDDNQIQTKASVNALLQSGYLPITGGNLTGTTTCKAAFNVLDTDNSATIELKQDGTLHLGQILNQQIAATNAYKYRVGEGVNSSYLDIQTTSVTGTLGSFGTVRVGTPIGSDNVFQVFSTDGDNNALLKVNNAGKAELSGAEATWANLNNNDIPTKRQVQAAIGTPSLAIPVGAIVSTLQTTAPPGWFMLNGGSYVEASYPLLAAILQGTQGYVAGKLPDYRGQHLVMKGGINFDEPVGTKYGSRTAMPNSPFSTVNDGTHDHTYGDDSKFGGGTTKSAFNAANTRNSFRTATGGFHNHVIAGGDVVTNPPTVVINWIIKY